MLRASKRSSCTLLKHLSQNLVQNPLQGTRPVPPQFFIQGFQALNEISNVLPGIHAPSSLTKVGAAAKGAMLIDGAAPILAKQGAGTVRPGSQSFPPAGADAACGIKRLTQRQHGSATRQTELTALGARLAVPVQGPGLQGCIHGTDLLALVQRGLPGGWSPHGL